MTKSRTFGRLDDGRDVTAHELIARDGLRLEVLDLGATVSALEVPAPDGDRVPIVLAHDTVEEYLAPGAAYFGAVVGRYANRIAGARFELDGRTHELTANEGPTCLHGGVDGFHRRLWTTVEADESSVLFELVSPDGDQGFPGRLTARAGYVVRPGQVTLTLTATTDAPTVVSLTNHAYFNLAGTDGRSVDDHLLSVAGDAFLPVDEWSIPLGTAEPVAGTPFDLTSPRRVGDVVRDPHPQIARLRGIDHAYRLDGEGFRRVARLEDVHSGRSLEVHTDQPSLQVYTGNMLDGSLRGQGGRLMRQGDGVALETQRFPDAPNQDWLPSARLQPGEEYHAVTTWQLGW